MLAATPFPPIVSQASKQFVQGQIISISCFKTTLHIFINMHYSLPKLLAVTPKSRLQYRSGADVFSSVVMVNDAETKYQLSDQVTSFL